MITLLWGGVMIGMGFSKTWQQMAALRVVLGIFEAGFFPSCVYLLSTWYTRCKSGFNRARLRGPKLTSYRRRGWQAILGLLSARLCSFRVLWHLGIRRKSSPHHHGDSHIPSL